MGTFLQFLLFLRKKYLATVILSWATSRLDFRSNVELADCEKYLEITVGTKCCYKIAVWIWLSRVVPFALASNLLMGLIQVDGTDL